MKNPIGDVAKNTILIGLTLGYIAGLFFWERFMLATTGFFIIAFIIIGLEKWTAKKILLILSPILTYPPLLIIGVIFSHSLWLVKLKFFIVIFGLIYGFLLRGLWSWVTPKIRTTLVSTFLVIGLLGLLYGYLMDYCRVVSFAEKGVTQEQISKCNFFNLYDPTLANLVPSELTEVTAVSSGPSFLAGILILNYLFIFNKRKKSSLDKE